MSEFEYQFAVGHIDDYELFFVRNVSARKDKPEILILQDLFVDNELNEKGYLVEVDRTYTISAEIQQMRDL